MKMKTTFNIICLLSVLLFPACDSHSQVEWKNYSEQNLTEALHAGKPIVLYFSAAWCPMCYRLKGSTFKDPRVVQLLGKFSCLKADLSFSRSPKVAELVRYYDVSGVPTLIFFSSSGDEIFRIPGYLGADHFLQYVEQYNAQLA